MKISFSMKLVAALTVLLAACAKEPAANKLCKGEDGTIQDCGIACDTSKAADVCKLFETKTKAVCDKVGKQKCSMICEKDKNEYACAYAKTMK
jgi:hypothetical protein